MEYKASLDIVSRKNQDGTVVIMKMDDSNNFFKIDGVAAIVWDGFATKKPLADIKKNIHDNYNVTDTQLNQDIDKLIKVLLEKQLIESY